MDIFSFKFICFLIFFPPVSIVLGVPTIKREKISYLTETLRSLIDELSVEEKEDCLIVLFIAEVINFLYLIKIL